MRLARAESGETTVTAMFAGGFMIAGIYYLAGVGDAMVYHQTMRDAADATAFAPSVMHARGMNVIALVNLVMSAILAVLVAVKIVQLLLLAAQVIACAMPLNPYCPVLTTWQDPFAKFVKLTDQSVSKVNRGLYAAETSIAKTMPLLGQVKAIAAAQSYAPVVENGFTANMSLVPGEIEHSSRWGLPVEDEEYKNLCLHASEQVEEILFKPLKFLPGSNVIVEPIKKLVGSLIGKLVKAFPQYFCGGTPTSTIESDVGKIAKDICKGSFNPKTCEKGSTDSMTSIAKPSAIGGNKQTSKRVLRGAVLGGDPYSAQGIVYSRQMEKNDRDQKMTYGSQGRVAPKTNVLSGKQGPLLQKITRAQISRSETYYDPRKSGPKSSSGIQNEGLLNMRWRARLRLMRSPSSAVRSLLTGPGLGSILSSAKGVPDEAIQLLTTFLGWSPEQLEDLAQEALGKPSFRTPPFVH